MCTPGMPFTPTIRHTCTPYLITSATATIFPATASPSHHARFQVVPVRPHLVDEHGGRRSGQLEHLRDSDDHQVALSGEALVQDDAVRVAQDVGQQHAAAL